MIRGCEALSYPTIGIVLLGGLSDPDRRIPGHPSAGFAYTSGNFGIYTKTRIFFKNEPSSVTINGKEVDVNSARSPFNVINRYLKDTGIQKGNLSIVSTNTGIISGSSDSGAAALAIAAGKIFGVTELHKLEADFREISESIGRSLFGGLTVTGLKNGKYLTEMVAPWNSFEGFRIVAFKFSSSRNPSDVIHSNIIRSPRYVDRIESASRKCETVKKLASVNDIRGIFDLSMYDTEEYHELIESVGVRVISGEMRQLITSVSKMRDDFWCSYIVTGGTNVFVPVERENADKIVKLAVGFNCGVEILRVAPGARAFLEF